MSTDQQQKEPAKRAQWPGTYAPEDREPLKDPDLRLGRRLLLVVPITWLLYSAIVWTQEEATGDDWGRSLLVLLGAAILVVPLVGCYGFGAWLVRGAWRKNNWPEKPDRRVHPALYDVRRLRRIAFVVLLCWWSVIALPWSILSLVFDR
jgi:hypothetical protein